MRQQKEAPTTSAAGHGLLNPEPAEYISERLSKLDNLYFPRAKQSSIASPSQRKTLLLDLLSRDVAVFLERYGSQLTLEELKEFDALKADYEINWHLSHLRSLVSPTKEELKLRSVTIKNRRRAYLDKLVGEGQYFSEDAMRERDPYLHHEYLGKFQDLSGRRMARPGERWSETLIRRAEEAVIVQKIRAEQQRRGVAESEWVGSVYEPEQLREIEMEEEEDDSEDESEDELKGHIASGSSHIQEVPLCDESSSDVARPKTEGERLSAEEMQDRLDQFTIIMHQKFLSGEDYQHFDYSEIDKDESLDDHWIKEANHDAEEKYFDDD